MEGLPFRVHCAFCDAPCGHEQAMRSAGPFACRMRDYEELQHVSLEEGLMALMQLNCTAGSEMQKE